jgi:uncharacterized protein (TIGR00369 family)
MRGRVHMPRLVDDRYCFVCGVRNPIGLHVRTEREEGVCLLRWTPSREYQGFQDVLHGGIISALLDEAMAHAVLTVAPGAATAALEVSFQKPTRTDREVLVSARVEERKGRIVKAAGSLSQEGETRASARGTFLVVAKPPRGAEE